MAAFAQMMTGRHGDRLGDWIAAIEADDLPHLRSFTNGLKRDHAAVLNGLTLAHSFGAVEGAVNRIKMLKRQMYGRANSTCCANASCLPTETQVVSFDNDLGAAPLEGKNTRRLLTRIGCGAT